MENSRFPNSSEEVIATLIELYRHQNQTGIVELLENATGRIEETNFDNWNGGTYSYALILEIPIPVFASHEAKLPEIGQSIVSKLQVIYSNLSNDHLDSVNIIPQLSKAVSTAPMATAPESSVKHIWADGFFRLFLSHVAAHKIQVAKLKQALRPYGITAFVAHEDIIPSLEWQNEIELALQSMYGMAALLTPDFHDSKWTDQEIGVALGRNILVIPIRLGTDPYGFIGKVQGLPGSLEQPTRLAESIFKVLLDKPKTHKHMRKALVLAFGAASSFQISIALSKLISTLQHFAEDEKAILRRACKENDQVFLPQGVVTRICKAIGDPSPHKDRTV